MRRLAARLLKCGESRIRIADAKRAGEALTADDVRELVKEKIVYALPPQGVSRGKARWKQQRKRKGRRRGRGSQRGAAYAVATGKEIWMRKARAQRKLLKAFKSKMEKSEFRKVYKMVKGNAFSDKKRLAEYLKKFAKKGVKVG